MKADKTWEEYKRLPFLLEDFTRKEVSVVFFEVQLYLYKTGVWVKYEQIENSFKDPCNPEKIELDCWKLQYGFDWIFDEDIKT